jgi:putative hydrolase of the HAD superfamily
VSGGVQLVVFDLGRVLVRICDGWQHACEVAGVGGARGRLHDDDYAVVHAAMCAHEVGETSLDEFAQVAAPPLGLTPTDFIRMHNAYTRGVYDGAVALLDDLRAAGVATACLSNTNANHWRIMSDAAGNSFVPFEKFTHAFASHLLRLRKPDDAIYAEVERATGVDPRGILFFDDVAENIAAAARRGWRAHQIALDGDPVRQLREALRCEGVSVD